MNKIDEYKQGRFKIMRAAKEQGLGNYRALSNGQPPPDRIARAPEAMLGFRDQGLQYRPSARQPASTGTLMASARGLQRAAYALLQLDKQSLDKIPENLRKQLQEHQRALYLSLRDISGMQVQLMEREAPEEEHEQPPPKWKPRGPPEAINSLLAEVVHPVDASDEALDANGLPEIHIQAGPDFGD